MAFAEGFARLDEKALSFKVLLAQRTIEALRVVVVAQSLNPSVPCLDWKATGDALGGEQFVPIFLAVGKSVL